MKYKRIFLIVLDSLGVGGANDQEKYQDVGANTFKNIVLSTNIGLPNLKKLGLYNLVDLSNNNVLGAYTKIHPLSEGKDTLTGHLEMMGIITKIPFLTFKDGFDLDLIEKIEQIAGRKVIGNEVASGTEIIERLGEEHLKTGSIIVYTSTDSVLQIAAHEEIVKLEELYDICSKVRELTKEDKYKVGRVIARPFVGSVGNFTRTGNRKDYALDPNGKTVLDKLKDNNYDVIGVGKISDVFNHNGITKSIKTKDNEEGIKAILDCLKEDFTGLCFINLNDFDSKYGHRRDYVGYANALKDFDNALPSILFNLKEDDLFIITADHGNDPTYRGTDHTREQVPVMLYNKNIKVGKLKDLIGFNQIGNLILKNFLGEQ